MNNLDPLNVSSTELAEVLGMTRQRVSQLRSEGVIRNNGKRGEYNLFDAVPAYLDHLRANKGSDVNARLKLAQVQKIQLYVEQMENELVKTSDAAEVFRVAFTLLRDIAEAIPKRIATQIAKSKSPDEIRMILSDELNRIGSELEKGLNQHLDGATRHGTANHKLPISRRCAAN